jgi:hypothetical protein
MIECRLVISPVGKIILEMPVEFRLKRILLSPHDIETDVREPSTEHHLQRFEYPALRLRK